MYGKEDRVEGKKWRNQILRKATENEPGSVIPALPCRWQHLFIAVAFKINGGARAAGLSLNWAASMFTTR